MNTKLEKFWIKSNLCLVKFSEYEKLESEIKQLQEKLDKAKKALEDILEVGTGSYSIARCDRSLKEIEEWDENIWRVLEWSKNLDYGYKAWGKYSMGRS